MFTLRILLEPNQSTAGMVTPWLRHQNNLLFTSYIFYFIKNIACFYRRIINFIEICITSSCFLWKYLTFKIKSLLIFEHVIIFPCNSFTSNGFLFYVFNLSNILLDLTCTSVLRSVSLGFLLLHRFGPGVVWLPLHCHVCTRLPAERRAVC